MYEAKSIKYKQIQQRFCYFRSCNALKLNPENSPRLGSNTAYGVDVLGTLCMTWNRCA